ncbi:ataxin-7-like protein 2b [Aulostomus maculatus]
MAALDRRNANLDDFVGLNWSCWVDRANILTSDAASNVEDSSKHGRSCCETMTLRKEDMHIFGQCPAHDDFYLVVCSHCGQVVKPQAFEKHCERRHAPLTKTCGRSCAPQQCPRPGRLPLVEKVPLENLALPPHSASTPRTRVPQLHSLPPGLYSSSFSSPVSERLLMQKPTAGQSTESSSPLRGTRTYSQIYKNIDKKECDPNKRCSVLDQERKKLCSRELTCNKEESDAAQLQQRSLCKTKTSEEPAVQPRAASAGRDMEQLPVKPKEREQRLEGLQETITTRCRQRNFNSSCHSLGTRRPSASFPEEGGDSTLKVEVQPPYPFNQDLLSSEESEDEEQDEASDLPATPWHPKPLGLCTFGCRTLGCSIFTFDRRLHHLRFALSAMLEHHVSAHLWKKMPQVSSGLKTPVRSGSSRSHPRGSLSLESTSLGRLETRSSQRNLQSATAPSSNSSKRLGLGQQRTPVSQSGKDVDNFQDASATKLSHTGGDKSSRHIRDPLLREKGQMQAPSSRGLVNGTSSHGKRPCPPLPLQPSERHLSSLEKRPGLPAPHCSPRCKTKPPGLQQKLVGYDQRALEQKRKGSSDSQALSSSLSRTSKCPRLSSPHRSALISWKGESIADVLSWGLEKRSDS